MGTRIIFNNHAGVTSWLILLFLATGCPVYAADPSREELEKWFESDDLYQPDTVKISEGELRFLNTPPDKRVPSVFNEIKVSPDSIQKGWVDIKQCYKQLDPIDSVEVVYRYKQMRRLSIHSYKNIDKVSAKAHSVQLDGVGREAELCVVLQAKIFYRTSNNQFVLRNGPFERKFLDGYYPFHVIIKVSFPAEKIRFVSSNPGKVPGFHVQSDRNSLIVDTWFEGKLMTELVFETR